MTTWSRVRLPAISGLPSSRRGGRLPHPQPRAAVPHRRRGCRPSAGSRVEGRVLVERLADLDEGAVHGGGVQEADAAGDADACLLVDHLDALELQGGEVAFDVVGLKADVVEALALAVEVAGDAVICDDGLEELDLAIAHCEESGLHALLLDCLELVDGEAEGIAPEAHGVVDIADDDADVGDFGGHAAGL